MLGFPLGAFILGLVAILIFFGLAHRVLDRMGITDRVALAVLIAMIVGSFIDIPLKSGRVSASINLGGGVVPVALAVYVLARAGTAWEKGRTLLAILATVTVVWGINSVFLTGDPWQGGLDLIDPLFVYPLAAGIVAYAVGRTRRGSFVAAIIGVLALDLIDLGVLLARGLPGRVAIGGAGIFDTMVISGVIAVLLAEVIGETRERLQGGPQSQGRPKALVEALKGEPLMTPEPARRPLGDNNGFPSEEEEENKGES